MRSARPHARARARQARGGLGEGRAEGEPWQHTFEFLEYTSKTGLFVKPLVLDLLKELDLTTQDVGVKFD